MMKTVKILFFSLVLMAFSMNAEAAQDYKASLFGIKSDGQVHNTRSIQKAIDYIHENGGGRLVFYVGRYVTGTLHLKSNVTIHLEEGAILVGSTNPYDYDRDKSNAWEALILAQGAENIGVTGKGVIDGRGREVAYNLIDQIHKGFIKDDLKYDRPNVRPTLIYFRECKNVKIEEVTMQDAAFWVQIYDQCTNLTIDKITVNSTAFWNNDGLDIVDCENVKVTNSFINAADDAICLKSHDPNKLCNNIEIRNCVARSSASGIKFGTVSRGGYKNIKIINNKVYDTFRSAFTIGAVDGSEVENILVDSLYVYNTGNVIFLRIGDRWSSGKKPYINGVTIQNVYAEVAAGKPDAGYDYEGPVEDMPRNISPSSIIGLPGMDIENVTLRNVEIVFPGGGDAKFAYRGTSAAELNSIPEMEKAYPEFSQFKELPAWAMYIRHAKGITFENVTFTAKARDYRPAVVMDDVKGATFTGVKYNEPGGSKKQVVTHQSTGVVINK